MKFVNLEQNCKEDLKGFSVWVCVCYPGFPCLLWFSVDESHVDLRCVEHLGLFANKTFFLCLHCHPHSTGLLGAENYARSYGKDRLRRKLGPHLARIDTVVKKVVQTHERKQFKMLHNCRCGRSSKEGPHWGPGAEGRFLEGIVQVSEEERRACYKSHKQIGDIWAPVATGQNKYCSVSKVESDWELEDFKSGLGKSVNCQEMRQVYSFISCHSKYGRDKYNS